MRTRFRVVAVLVMMLSMTSARLLAEDDPSISQLKIEVEPGSIELRGGGARQQIVISARNLDGSFADLTRSARVRVEPPDLAWVSPMGVVLPSRDGRGALTIDAGGRTARVDVSILGSSSPGTSSYRRDIVALLAKSGCNMGACHGNQNGKGGFKLSLRGEGPDQDYLSLTRDTRGRRVDVADPARSLVLLKPLGQVAHEGGPRIEPGGPEQASLIGWIASGAIDDKATAPRLTKLDVWPVDRRISGGLAQQLIVTARFSDGSMRDVTRACAYDPSDPTFLNVDADGLATASSTGEATVAVRYLEGRAVARLAFLPGPPGSFAWTGPEGLDDPIDRAVMGRLRELRVNPSPLCSDEVFLRRAYLDAIGTLPTVEEARSFLADTDAGKREALIDHLVQRPEFADFWALKWADLLRNEEKGMGSKGVQVLRRWLRDQVDADVPMDRMAGALVSSVGSTWSVPAASFHRTNRSPEAAAEAVSQVFLGLRLQCARCHNHPFDSWTQADYFGLAAFFSNLDRKEVGNERKDRLDKHEINGDEIISVTDKAPGLVHPRTGAWLRPKPPMGPELPDDDRFALDNLAEWLSTANWQVAQNLSNRVWFHLLGRGVVEPVDDFRLSNPPSNLALLVELTRAIEASEGRLKPLVRRIMRTTTYQLSSEPGPTNASDDSHFARYPVRVLSAEVLLDAIGQCLERREATRAIARPGVTAGKGSVDGPFLQVFGKPDRLLTCECERSSDTTLAQAFQLLNGPLVRGALEHPENRIGRLIGSGASDLEVLNELYLAALSRMPTPSERDAVLAHLSRRKDDRRKAWEDAAWAVLNSKEFLLRH